MELEQYIAEKTDLYQKLLEFIDDGGEEEYQKLEKALESQKIKENQPEIRIFIGLVSKICNNHHRLDNFFNKIEKILFFMKEVIKQTYSNIEIFNIFKSNKRILYFLFKENFIDFDESISKRITSENFFIHAKYPNYFITEIKKFIPNKLQKRYESQNRNLLNLRKNEKINDDDFEKMRNIGENETHICQLIRNDSVDDFISYVNQNSISFTTIIKPSIFESNSFLIKNNPTLIEYSAFFGSIQIFKYLILNKIELKPSIWMFAIHGRNAELIHILEEYKIEPPNNNFQFCLNESLKCHHNEIANYLFDSLLENSTNSSFSESIRYFNFYLFPEDLTVPHSFFNLCRSNYIYIVDFLLKTMNFDVNTKIINILQV